MTAAVSAVRRSIYLSGLHHAWTNELARHWPGDDETCLGCGQPYPCRGEIEALDQLAKVVDAWTRLSVSVEWRQALLDCVWSWTSGEDDATAGPTSTNRAPGGAPHTSRPAPLDPRRWA